MLVVAAAPAASIMNSRRERVLGEALLGIEV
jgi:hypothetical protein